MSKHHLDNYEAAKKAHAEAVSYLAIIGKTTKHTTVASREGEAATAGSLTTFKVNTQINFQETDGGTNYHNSTAFDAAISTAAREQWTALRDRALGILDAKVVETGKGARAYLAAQLASIDGAKQ